MSGSEAEHISVTRFRQYLRIETVQPKPDYASARTFLESYAKEIGLKFNAIDIVPGKCACVLTWEGSNKSLKSIMLNSHIDVVPVSEDKWTYPPFGASKVNGRIYARGAQDMKCVGIQYLEAIRILKAAPHNYTPQRTIHVTFVPDEEVGGIDGMKKWVVHQSFKDLNVGFALDEGLGNPEDAYKLYYGERPPWWLNLYARGGAGHGSQFVTPSATERLLAVLAKFSEFREAEHRRLQTSKNLRLGDVTTINTTILNAGVQHNVVPETVSAGIDIRIAPSVNLHAFKDMIEEWCKTHNVEIEYVNVFWSNATTPLSASNPYYKVVKSVSDQKGIRLDPDIFPAATDSRYVREIGIPAFGISPMRKTPVLLHDHDEYLDEHIFLEGVQWYVDIIRGIADVTEEWVPESN
ncbi:hypothetical protein BC832DRAFT_597539 [Gaertneriomyces semiglobifer]|nr:hypothetical protein BC832DRAFT_597539 [Gaertneriomyces semiglobifer]